MTFDAIVTEVMARTRQTSSEATTRIGRAVNDRHRRVTSTLGLQVSRFSTESAVIGEAPLEPAQAVFPLAKLTTVYLLVPARLVLQEITLDQYRSRVVASDATGTPTVYAVTLMVESKTEIRVYPTPPNLTTTLWADGLAPMADLVGTAVPSMPTDFHDILMHGALADEWQQLKQDDLSTRSEAMYETRLSELRYFIAKSNCLAIAQGTRAPNNYPYNPWYPYQPWML
jgi:hypothetical protein